ncbi:AAA family ATPase [Flavobacterium chungangense]|uniref:AAA family ATPase n=2 Tax=Flavobacterium chungangense TaxID=554283 RepID=UPI0004DF0488|nr:AAA family ATPase [Flavobacterium chungangense]
MERAKLIVKNFGPLKDIDIEVREMVTFIGAQASGKSTLAKLLSIFEDEGFRRDNTISFEDELKKYNIYSYLNENTFIEYSAGIIVKKASGFVFKFLHTNKNKSLKFNLRDKTKKDIIETFLKEKKVEDPKLIEKFELIFTIDSVLANKDFRSVELFNVFKDSIKEPITAEDFEVFFNVYEEFLFENSGISVIYDSIYIPSERNFLHLIAENTLGLINNNVQIPKHLLSSGQEYEKALQTIKELPLSIIDKKIKYKREGKTSYIYHNEKDKVDLLESASGLQSVVPILLLVEYSKSLKEKYNFNFVVEEPELNLYPKAQHELIKYLVKNCLFDRKNLILTTHSPFVLASINNLLLAYDKGQKNPKEVNKIIKKESWLNPKNFIAYELKNGKAKKIMNDKLGQISENMIDGVSDAFANEFDKLLDL